MFNREQVAEYTEALYERRESGVHTKCGHVENPDWQPDANRCHDNAAIFCEYSPDHAPVRGWLYFDFPLMNYVKFLAHSVVRTPDGDLFDITPANRSQPYPFIEALLTDEEFFGVESNTEDGNLVYHVRTRNTSHWDWDV